MFSHVRQDPPLFRLQAGAAPPASPAGGSSWLTSRPQSKFPPAFTLVSFPLTRHAESFDLPQRPSWPGQQKPGAASSTRPHYPPPPEAQPAPQASWFSWSGAPWPRVYAAETPSPQQQTKPRRSKTHHKKRLDEEGRRRHKKKSKRRAEATGYPVSGSNWAFQGGRPAVSTPQVSTLETTTFVPQHAEASYVRRLTSETESEQPRRAGLQTFSETLRQRAPAFQPLRVASPLRQPLPPPWRVAPSPSPPAWVASRPAVPPSVITRYNVAKVFSFAPLAPPPVSAQVVDKLVYAVHSVSPPPAPEVPIENHAAPVSVPAVSPPTVSPPPVSMPAVSAPPVSLSAVSAPAVSIPAVSAPSEAVSRHAAVSEEQPSLLSPVFSARLGRAPKQVPPKPTPTRSVSVSMNDCAVSHQKKASSRRVKNRSLQLQADKPSSEATVAFQTSPQRLPKPASTGTPANKSPGLIQRFASSGDAETASPPAVPWKSASIASLQPRTSFATPSTALGPVADEWSPLDQSPSPPSPPVSSPDNLASPGRSSFPSFPKTNAVPGFAEFVLGLLASQKLLVEFHKDEETDSLVLSLFEGSLDHLLTAREMEFTTAVESQWAIKSSDLSAAAKLFSQATLSQVADVQRSNWFLDDNGSPMTIQSQLLTHVYHASHPRELFGNYFNAGTQGLDKSLDLPKHLEIRRIQNSIRRFLEFSMESFLIDTCLGIKHGCLDDWETDGQVRDWIECARVLAFELFRRPMLLATHLRSLFAFLKEKAGRALPEEDCGASAIPGEQLESVIGDLGWWPPELNLEDRREILEAVSLGNSKAQHNFARQSQLPLCFDPSRLIFEEDFVSVLCSVPLNQPDFILNSSPKNFKDLAAQNQLDEILREVVRVAKNIAHSILNTKNDEPFEINLANDRLMLSVNQHAAFQTRDSVRSRLFAAQDFLASYAVSIEELQIMALEHFPLWPAHTHTFSTDSLAPSQSSDSALSNNDEPGLLTPLEIAEEIIRVSKSPTGFDFKDEVLPCLNIVQLAVEYMVGLSIHAMTNSERFTVRAPLSTLAVRVDPASVVTRFESDPCPLPRSAECMPLECHALGGADKEVCGAVNSSVAQCDFSSPEELVKCTRTYEKNTRAQVTQSPGVCSEASTQGGSEWQGDTSRRAQVSAELLQAFVVIHSYESLREIQRLFITTEANASNSQQKNAITMKNEDLKAGEPQAWNEFWNQGGDLASSLASHVQAGSWGPIRWNSLREISAVFCELQKKTSPLAELG